jgi:hypothetical protein
MATSAFLSSQTLLKIGNGASPQVFTLIGEVTTIGELAQKKDLVEVTHMTSLGKEFIGGLSDGQEMEITCNLLPTNAQQVAMLVAAGTTSAAKDFRYVLPSAGNNLTFSFSALILSSALAQATPNTAAQVKFGLKISGAIVGPQ